MEKTENITTTTEAKAAVLANPTTEATEAKAAAEKKALLAVLLARKAEAATEAAAKRKAATEAAAKAAATDKAEDYKAAAAAKAEATEAAAAAKEAATIFAEVEAETLTSNSLLQKLLVKHSYTADDMKPFSMDYLYYNRMINGAFGKCVFCMDAYLSAATRAAALAGETEAAKEAEEEKAEAVESFMKHFNNALCWLSIFCGYEKTVEAAKEKNVPVVVCVRKSAFPVFASAASTFSKTKGFALRSGNYYKAVAIYLVCDKLQSLPFAQSVNREAVKRAEKAISAAAKAEKAEKAKAEAAAAVEAAKAEAIKAATEAVAKAEAEKAEKAKAEAAAKEAAAKEAEAKEAEAAKQQKNKSKGKSKAA